MRRLLIVLLLVTAAACSSDEPQAADSPEPTTSPPAEACSETTTIIARDNSFDPACLAIDVEHPGITIRNQGAALHNFSVEGFVHDVDTQPGEETNTENLGLEAGTYRFFCKYHEDLGMEGEIRIEEA